ncbi:hypothetical protein HD806DRAFT_50741 [Xylariaceae sp. AK1471]|nr:hypothetical protein HD806DRAFT_50741 [Xylariaceae sp. AK1471]
MVGKPPFPPLTTIFTPPPECTSPYLVSAVYTSTYEAYVFYEWGEFCGSQITSCFPSTHVVTDGTDTFTGARQTYAPGLYCPAGMMTVADADYSLGTVCCPSGMTYNNAESYCEQPLPEGVYMVTPQCTPTTYSGSGLNHALETVSVGGKAVYLLPESLQNSIPSTTGASSSGSSSSDAASASDFPPLFSSTTGVAPSDSSDSDSDSSDSSSSSPDITGRRGRALGMKIGLGVGIPVVLLLLIAVASILARRYRKRRRPKGAVQTEYNGKPELDATATATTTAAAAPNPLRSELDPSTWRAEVDGAAVHVHPSELQGTGPSSSSQSPKDGPVNYYIERWELDASPGGGQRY